MTTNLDKVVVEFDYTQEALENLVAEYKDIDRGDFEAVNEAKNILVKARTTIEKKGKEYRDSAHAFNKKVMAIQKGYIEITQPLEEDFKQILADEKERQIKEARADLLPMKKNQLSLLKHLNPLGRYAKITDDEILEMDDASWVEFYQGAMEENTNFLAQEQQKIEDEANREARDEEVRKETEARLEREAKQKEEEEKREEKNRKARLKRDKRRTDFLTKNKYNKETDKVEDGADGSVKIYRLVATLNPEK